MGLLDGPLRSAAQTALRTFGTPITLRQNSAGAFDPLTDRVLVTSVDRPVKALLAEVKLYEVRGPIQAGDYKLLFAPADVPETVDESWTVVLADGQELEVVLVIPYIATDQPALVEVYARGRRSA